MYQRKRGGYFAWLAAMAILFLLMATGKLARVDFDSLHAVRDIEDEAIRSGQLAALHLRCTPVPIDPTGMRQSGARPRVIRVVVSHIEQATDLDCVLVRR